MNGLKTLFFNSNGVSEKGAATPGTELQFDCRSSDLSISVDRKM